MAEMAPWRAFLLLAFAVVCHALPSDSLRWNSPAHPFAARGASSVVQELRGPRAGVVAQVSALRGGSGVLEQVQRRDGAPQNKDLTVEQESPKWRPTPASDRHDIVNIFVLSLLGSGAIAGVIWNSNQDLHTALTFAGFAYILLDSIWMVLQPEIVKSPLMVVGHHIATLAVLADPLLEPRHRVYTSACLLVEINTLLLLLRRRLAYSGWVELPFIVSWVALRNLWYPCLMFYFFLCYAPATFIPLLPASLKWVVDLRAKLEWGEPRPMLAACMLSWTAVCAFQFKWTIQLFGAHPWIWGKKQPAQESSPARNDRKNYL